MHNLDTEIVRFIRDKESEGTLPPHAGIAVSIARFGQPPFRATFGFRDRQKALPVTTKTLFPVASLTKSFSALTLMILSEAGRIELDEPVNSRNDLFRLKDDTISRSFTYADILSHRIGLPANDILWILGPALDSDALKSRLVHLDLIPNQFRDKSGKVFSYNNLLYATLKYPIEEASNETFERFLQTKILERLEMKNSTFSRAQALACSDIALPFAGGEPLAYRETAALSPACGLYSNVDDLTLWLAFQLSRGKLQQGQPIVSPNAFDLMHKSQIRVEPPLGLIFNGLEWLTHDISYGYGWFLGNLFGYRAVYHMGLIDGFSSAIVLLPDLEIGIVTLVNLSISPVPGLLIARLLGLLLGQTISTPQTTPQPLAPSGSSSPPFSTQDLQGRYEEPGYGALTLHTTEGGAYLKYYSHNWPLQFVNDEEAVLTLDVWGMSVPLPARFAFEAGKLQQIIIPLSLDPRVPPRVFSRVF